MDTYLTAPKQSSPCQREKLPNRRASESFQFEHQSIAYTATISRYGDGRLAKIFIDHSKPNSQIAEHANDAAVLASLLLQNHITAAAIKHSISGPLSTALDLIEERAP